MSRGLRRLLVCGGVVCVAALAAVAVLARVQTHPTPAEARVPAPLAVGTELSRPRAVPDIPLISSAGRRTSPRAWRGKWVVLAPSMTLCSEVCPITTGALIQLTDLLRRAGLSHRVVVAEATVDPWRDTPRRLRAYARMAGVNFQMVTGHLPEIRRLWRFFGVQFRRVPQGDPPAIDWMTHRPLTFDVDHTDALFFISPSGQERIADESMPSVHHLSATLRRLLDSSGRHNLSHPQAPWTAREALDDVEYLMGRTIPRGAAPVTHVPSAAAARRELAGSPHPLAALHAEAGELLGAVGGLRARLASLRGRYPAVVNVWASWCFDCRAEFPQFAAASARFGRRIAFLGADYNDSSSNARAFLAGHHVSYPSYQASSGQLSFLAQIEGVPMTIFVARDGRVAHVHIDQYQTSSALDDDIERYSH